MLTKLIDSFRKPSASVIAERDLEEAKRLLLKEQSATEYHQQMAAYYKAVIARLTTYTKSEA